MKTPMDLLQMRAQLFPRSPWIALPFLVGIVFASWSSEQSCFGQTPGPEVPDPKERVVATIPELQPEVASLDIDCHAVYEDVRKAIVCIKTGRSQSNGTLISPQGHVLTKFNRNIGNAPFEISLSDGTQYVAEQLGWSSEWKIAILKITREAPFPYVRMSEVPRPGTHCLGIGFPTQTDFQPTEPVVRFGIIQTDIDRISFSAKIPFYQNIGTGLFDSRGCLIGMNTAFYKKELSVFTPCHVVKELWSNLTKNDTNLDAVRSRNANIKLKTQPGDHSSKEAAIAASVRIKLVEAAGNWSGTIISSDGYIATCAHHLELPGTRVVVEVADGREVSGTVIGANQISDVGIVRLDGSDWWPHVELGSSIAATAGAPAMMLGFPKGHAKRQALLRNCKIVQMPWEKSVVPTAWIRWTSDSQTRGGDSGGGLFNEKGQLIGIHSGAGLSRRVETLAAQWDLLSALPKVRKLGSEGNANTPDAWFKEPASVVQQSVVQVFSGKARCCLGLIVSHDGRILTKASELKGDLSCRLAGGEQHSATLVCTSRENDLALLKIDAKNLGVCPFAKTKPAKFEFVAAVLPKSKRSSSKGSYPYTQPQVVGIVTHEAMRVEALPGFIGRIRNSEQGVEVFSSYRCAKGLKKSDRVLSVNGHPTPTVDRLNETMKNASGDVIAFPGESVPLRLLRDGQELELNVFLNQRPSYSLQAESARRSGFASAFDCDVSLYPNESGAPIVNREGKVIGIAIATRGRGYLYAIPSQSLEQFLNLGDKASRF